MCLKIQAWFSKKSEQNFSNFPGCFELSVIVKKAFSTRSRMSLITKQSRKHLFKHSF